MKAKRVKGVKMHKKEKRGEGVDRGRTGGRQEREGVVQTSRGAGGQTKKPHHEDYKK